MKVMIAYGGLKLGYDNFWVSNWPTAFEIDTIAKLQLVEQNKASNDKILSIHQMDFQLDEVSPTLWKIDH